MAVVEAADQVRRGHVAGMVFDFDQPDHVGVDGDQRRNDLGALACELGRIVGATAFLVLQQGRRCRATVVECGEVVEHVEGSDLQAHRRRRPERPCADWHSCRRRRPWAECGTGQRSNPRRPSHSQRCRRPGRDSVRSNTPPLGWMAGSGFWLVRPSSSVMRSSRNSCAASIAVLDPGSNWAVGVRRRSEVRTISPKRSKLKYSEMTRAWGKVTSMPS